MTDTTVSGAVVFPEDDGTGVTDGSEDYNSAGYFSLLAKYKGDGTYVAEDSSGNATLQFANVDTTNETVDVESGYAYIMDSGTSVQAGSQTTYNTTLPNETPYVVILPNNETGLGLGTDTGNDLWLAIDPTSNDSVYIRHGSGLSAPSDPSVKLGTVNSSDGSTTRPNDLATTSIDTLNTDQVNTDRYIEPSDGDPFQVINDYITNNDQNGFKFILAPGDYTTSTQLDLRYDQRTNLGRVEPVIIEGYMGQESTGDGTFIDCSGFGADVAAIQLASAGSPNNYFYFRNFTMSDTDQASIAMEADGGLIDAEFDGVAFDGFDTQIRTHGQVIRSEFTDVFSRDGQFIHASDDVSGSSGWNVDRFEGVILKNNSSPAMQWDGISLASCNFHGDAANCDGIFWQLSGDGAGSTTSISHDWHFESMAAGSGVPIFDVSTAAGNPVNEIYFTVYETGTAGGDFLRVGSNGRITFCKIFNSGLTEDLGGLCNVNGTFHDLVIESSEVRCDSDMTGISGVTWDGVAMRNTGQTNTWPDAPTARRQNTFGWSWYPFEPRSSVPPSADAGVIYLDDGTNTGDSNFGLRVYNGTSWVDL